jgi:hypothetical protein
VRIFDIRNIKEPIIDWAHDMRDGPPRYVFVAPQNDQKYQCKSLFFMLKLGKLKK